MHDMCSTRKVIIDISTRRAIHNRRYIGEGGGISHKTPKRKKTKTKTKPSIVFDSGGSIQPDSQKRTLETLNIKNLRKTAEKNN